MSEPTPPLPEDPRRERLGPLLARWTTWRIWLDRPSGDAPDDPAAGALPPLDELLAWYAAQQAPVVRSDRPRAGPWLRVGHALAAVAGPAVAAGRWLIAWLWCVRRPRPYRENRR